MDTGSITYVSARTETFRDVVRPLALRTFKNLGTCLQWAWLDTLCQYRRSKIGPLWETINILVMAFGLTIVSSAIIGGDMSDLLGHVVLGIIVWTAISSVVTEGSTTFIRNSSLILNSNVSIDCYVGKTIIKIMVVFSHHAVLYFLGAALSLVPLTWTALLAVPGIALLFINAYWLVIVLAFLCARYRDVEQIIRNLLQLAFFVTPVFWNHEIVAAGKRFIVDYNILFYLVEIIRSPLLGKVPPPHYYLVAIGLAIVGFSVAVLVYRKMRRRLAFFV